MNFVKFHNSVSAGTVEFFPFEIQSYLPSLGRYYCGVMILLGSEHHHAESNIRNITLPLQYDVTIAPSKEWEATLHFEKMEFYAHECSQLFIALLGICLSKAS